VRHVFEDDTGRRARRLRLVVAPLSAIIGVAAVAALASVALATAQRPSDGPTAVLGARVETGQPFSIDVGAAPDAAPGKPCRVVDGTVYDDGDLNGARQPREQVVEGLQVTVWNPAGQVVGQATSDPKGAWSVTLPEPQLVRVEFFSPNLSMRPAPLGLDSVPFVSFPTEPNCHIEVGITWSGGHLSDVHPAMELGDRVWADTNCDGVQDPDEPGLARLTLELRDTDGRLLATTMTASTGEFRFGGLEGGRPYRIVAVDAPAGYTLTRPRIGAILNAEGIEETPFDEAQLPFWGADSNAVLTNGIAVADVVTGETGISDHSVDIGWAPASCAPPGR
jgi:hypothetical protein